nr:MAG: hypothetical protein [Molluscum contagiosum virus]
MRLCNKAVAELCTAASLPRNTAVVPGDTLPLLAANAAHGTGCATPARRPPAR